VGDVYGVGGNEGWLEERGFAEVLEAGIEKIAWGRLLEGGGYTESDGDGLGGEEVDGGEVGEGEEGGRGRGWR